MLLRNAHRGILNPIDPPWTTPNEEPAARALSFHKSVPPFSSSLAAPSSNRFFQ